MLESLLIEFADNSRSVSYNISSFIKRCSETDFTICTFLSKRSVLHYFILCVLFLYCLFSSSYLKFCLKFRALKNMIVFLHSYKIS